MAVNLAGADARPLILFKSPLKLAFNVLRSFGPGAMLGFVRLMKFCQYPAQVLDRFTARKAPRKLEELIAEAKTVKAAGTLGTGFQRLGHGHYRQIFSRSDQAPRTARQHGFCRGAGNLQRTLFARALACV